MLLRTLGDLRLESSTFTERKPLLLLCFLALGGRTVRDEIAELFWGESGERELWQKGLSEALRKLRKVDPGLIHNPDPLNLGTTVTTDVTLLREALAAGAYPDARKLYQGPFLVGLERQRRLKLGEELHEWIVDLREELHLDLLEAALAHAEALAADSRFTEAGAVAWDAYSLGSLTTYPTPDEYARLHTLLLAGGRPADAERVAADASSLYSDLPLARLPQEARGALARHHALPSSVRNFFGRQQELRELLEQFAAPGTQLLSVIGPAGIGKTELALRCAHEARRRELFPRMFGFAALDALPAKSDETALVDTLADALGLRLGGRAHDAEALANAIGERRTLLVVDNFEHLLPHAGVLATLRERCPELVLLVTSRTLLDLDGERPLFLEGLPCPPEDPEDTEDAENKGSRNVGRYPAVQLFVSSARQRGVELGRDAMPAVARITRLTGGLPLALKLAAGWMRSATPTEIAERLGGSLEVLGLGPRDLPERQRDLGAALEDSLALLPADAAAAFAPLAVFHGGLTGSAAAAVTGATPAQLRRLVEGSLLRFDAAAGRFVLHPLIHRFAETLLEASPDLADRRDAHARYYLSELQRLSEAAGEERAQMTKRLAPERANLEAAWRHAVRRNWRAELAATAFPLERLFDLWARYQAGADLLLAAEQALEEAAKGASDPGADAQPDPSVTLATLRACRSWLLVRLSAYDEAARLAEEALPPLRAAEDALGLRVALNSLGAARDASGDFAAARDAFEEALAREESDSIHAATALMNLGLNVKSLGDAERAEAYFRRARSLCAAHQRPDFDIPAARALAELLLERGNAAEAHRVAAEALTTARELGLEHWVFKAQLQLGRSHLALGRLDDAAACCHEVFEKIAAIGNDDYLREARCLEGEIAAARGDAAAANRAFADAVRLAFAGGHPPRRLDALERLLGAWLTLGETAGAALLGCYLSDAILDPRVEAGQRRRVEQLLADHANALAEHQPALPEAATPAELRVQLEPFLAASP